MFAMGDPSRIRELVTQAGFAEPEPEEIPLEFRYADFDDLWDTLVSLAGGSARATLAFLDFWGHGSGCELLRGFQASNRAFFS